MDLLKILIDVEAHKLSHPSFSPVAITFLIPIYFPFKGLMGIFILKIQTKSDLKVIISIFFYINILLLMRDGPDYPTREKVTVLISLEKERPAQKRSF